MSEHGITVYFNSSCPVCNADISAQKKRVTGYSVLGRDVHTDVAPRGDINSDLEFIRERLHVIDEEGREGIGVEVFETIWRHSPGEKWKPRSSACRESSKLRVGPTIHLPVVYIIETAANHVGKKISLIPTFCTVS